MVDLAFRQLRTDIGRSALTCAGIASVFAVILVLQGFREGLDEQLRDIALERGAHLVATQAGDDRVTVVLGEPVDAAEVGQVVEALVVFQVGADLGNPAFGHVDGLFARIFGDVRARSSPLRRMMRMSSLQVLKPELNTEPKVFYSTLDKEVR